MSILVLKSNLEIINRRNVSLVIPSVNFNLYDILLLNENLNFEKEKSKNIKNIKKIKKFKIRSDVYKYIYHIKLILDSIRNSFKN